MDWVLLSLISGLASGVLWTIGDILLVGFDVEEDKYQEFLQDSRINDKQTAVMMLSGSVRRLRSGALVANFSIPLMLLSLFSLYSLAQPSGLSIGVVLLGLGFSISPPAHLAFYYVGTLSKTLYEDYKDGKTDRASSERLVNEYLLFLKITWLAAVGITAAGWIAYAIQIGLGRTVFPAWFCLFTPVIVSPFTAILNSKLKLGRPYLNGAAFNIALTVFFLAATVYYCCSA